MFKNKLLLLAVMVGLFSLPAHAETDDVVVLVKTSGSIAEVNVSRSSYSQKIEKIMNSVNESVLPALSTREDHGAWKLKAVLVGLGLNASAGLGPILSVGAKSRLQLIYTKNGEIYVP